jgi:hypothetical protein
MSLCAAFICTTPLVLAAKKHENESARLEARSRVAPARHTITKDYIRQRVDWLRFKDRRHEKVFVYFDTLLGEGYDPFLLDGWLDGIYDGVIVVGMPEDLVLDYWGQPVFTNEIVFDGSPAQEWGVRLLPGRVEKVTVAGGKVVRVHG